MVKQFFLLRHQSCDVHVKLCCCSSGVAQGVVTGIRGLCNGLGPALFGFIFYLFHVDLNEKSAMLDAADKSDNLSHRTINSAIQVTFT